MSVGDRRATDKGGESVSAEEEQTEGEQSLQDDVEEPSAEGELPLDLVFEILKNERRRYVLQYLAEQDERVSLGALAEHIAARENDTTPDQLTSQERKRVYVGLYQCHLPKMDSADIVDFDKNRGTIELGPNAGQLDPYLDKPSDTERGWHRYYLGCAVCGVGLLAVAALTPLLPVLLAGALTVVGFLIFSLAHLYEHRRGRLPGGSLAPRRPVLTSRLN